MPNHCYSVPPHLNQTPTFITQNYPLYVNTDFLVNWNQLVWGKYNVLESDLTSVSTASTKLCNSNVAASSSIPTDNAFAYTYGTDVTNFIGVNINNMSIFNALEAQYVYGIKTTITNSFGYTNIQTTTTADTATV
jgi:hypothetical protein